MSRPTPRAAVREERYPVPCAVLVECVAPGSVGSARPADPELEVLVKPGTGAAAERSCGPREKSTVRKKKAQNYVRTATKTWFCRRSCLIVRARAMSAITRASIGPFI